MENLVWINKNWVLSQIIININLILIWRKCFIWGKILIIAIDSFDNGVFNINAHSLTVSNPETLYLKELLLKWVNIYD